MTTITSTLYVERQTERFEDLMDIEDFDGAAIIALEVWEVEPEVAENLFNQLPYYVRTKHGIDDGFDYED